MVLSARYVSRFREVSSFLSQYWMRKDENEKLESRRGMGKGVEEKVVEKAWEVGK